MLLGVLTFFLICQRVFADDFSYLGDTWFPVRTIAFFVVTAVEAYVFLRMSGLPYGRCLSVSFALNFFSALVGQIVAFFSVAHAPIFPFIVAYALLFFIVLRWKPPRWFWITALAAILLGAPITFGQTAFDTTRHGIVFMTALLMLFGFGTTLLTESIVLSVYLLWLTRGERRIFSWFLSRQNTWRAIMTANVVSYVVLIPFFIIAPPLRLTWVS
jgi:hypothetical protein